MYLQNILGRIAAVVVCLPGFAMQPAAQAQTVAEQQVTAAEPAAKPTKKKAAPKTIAKKKAAKKKTFKKLPVEAFAQLDFMDKATISPDGRFVAALLAIKGEQRIGIIPLQNNGQEKTISLRAPDDMSINWMRWVTDDHVLIGVTALVDFGSRSEQAYVSRLISVRRTDGHVERIMWDKKGQDAADVLWIDPRRNGDILVAAQSSISTRDDGFWPSVYRVNVPLNKSSREKKGILNVQNWEADSDGNLRFAIANNDRTGKQSLLYRGEGQRNFSSIQRSDLRDFDSVDLPFTFVPGTDNGLFFEEDENGKSVIKEMNLVTQEEVAIRHELPDEDIEGVRMSYDGKEILGYVTANKNKRYHWVDERLSGAQAYLEENVKGAQPVIVSYDRNVRWMLVWLSSSQNPGLYYLFDREAQALAQIAVVNEKIGSKRLAAPRYVKYTAADGLEIEAVLTMPQGRGEKNLPLIVMPHGGPWARDYVSYDYWAQFLANRGYVVLQPNFRGSSGYGKEFQDKGYGQMGLAMQDDVTDGVNYLIEKGIVDAGRVCIAGASYGGYSAMWGIAKDPDMYRCAISIAGVASLRREVNDFGGALLARTFKNQWGRMSEDFKAVSPANAVDRIKVPLLLIHGKRDDTVDYKQSVLMEKRMREAGKNVEMVLLEKADHYFQRQDDRIALLSAMEKFLAKHNPAD